MKKFISMFAAVSMLASMCVMPAVHADYTFDRSSANFIAGTDFENETPAADKAWAFMNNTSNTELSDSIKHSGKWSLHTKASSDDIEVSLNTANWSWAYWNGSIDKNSRGSALTVGETYKYSYWVYADELATNYTPDVYIRNTSGNSTKIIDKSKYTTLSKGEWNYFEKVFTAEKESLPFFYGITENLYIDDIKLEKVVAPTLVGTTLPDEGGIAELGYNKYTMTFDKNIKSATVTVDSSPVTHAISGKTVEFGQKYTTQGGNSVTVTVNVTDTDGMTATVTRSFTVSSNTLVAYADFDDTGSGITAWHYFKDNNDKTSLVDDACYSPSRGAKLSSASGNISLQTSGDGRVTGSKTTVAGHWYKMSFWAKPASETNEKTPQFCIAQNNAEIQWVTINNAAMTKYEVVFKSNSTYLPVFYRGARNGDIYIDDILIQEVEAPRDYTFTADKDKITAGATLTATLINERLESMDGVVIMALYKDNRLVEAKTATAAGLAKFASVTTDAITVPADISDGVYTAKAFLWKDTTSTLESIQAPITITE